MSALLASIGGAMEGATGASSVGGALGNMAMSSVMGDAKNDAAGSGLGQGMQNFMQQLLPAPDNSQPSGQAAPTYVPQNWAPSMQPMTSNPFLHFLIGGHSGYGK